MIPRLTPPTDPVFCKDTGFALSETLRITNLVCYLDSKHRAVHKRFGVVTTKKSRSDSSVAVPIITELPMAISRTNGELAS